MRELQRVWKHAGNRAESDDPKRARRRKKQESHRQAEAGVSPDHHQIANQQNIDLQSAIVRTPSHRNRPERIIPMRNRVDREMTCEAGKRDHEGMRREQASYRSTHYGMRAQDHGALLASPA